jgi:hypothetical protein
VPSLTKRRWAWRGMTRAVPVKPGGAVGTVRAPSGFLRAPYASCDSLSRGAASANRSATARIIPRLATYARRRIRPPESGGRSSPPSLTNALPFRNALWRRPLAHQVSFTRETFSAHPPRSRRRTRRFLLEDVRTASVHDPHDKALSTKTDPPDDRARPPHLFADASSPCGSRAPGSRILGARLLVRFFAPAVCRGGEVWALVRSRSRGTKASIVRQGNLERKR